MRGETGRGATSKRPSSRKTVGWPCPCFCGISTCVVLESSVFGFEMRLNTESNLDILGEDNKEAVDRRKGKQQSFTGLTEWEGFQRKGGWEREREENKMSTVTFVWEKTDVPFTSLFLSSSKLCEILNTTPLSSNRRSFLVFWMVLSFTNSLFSFSLSSAFFFCQSKKHCWSNLKRSKSGWVQECEKSGDQNQEQTCKRNGARFFSLDSGQHFAADHPE